MNEIPPFWHWSQANFMAIIIISLYVSLSSRNIKVNLYATKTRSWPPRQSNRVTHSGVPFNNVCATDNLIHGPPRMRMTDDPREEKEDFWYLMRVKEAALNISCTQEKRSSTHMCIRKESQTDGVISISHLRRHFSFHPEPRLDRMFLQGREMP